MKFQIDFNHINNDKLLEQLGGKLINLQEHYYYELEINSIEELELLQKRVCEVTDNNHYMLLIDFDSPSAIFFNDKP